MGDFKYTVIITSCGRHDLLKRTLDSFAACIDITPEKVVIVEDNPATTRPDWLGERVVWIQNPENMGQAYSIDRAYEEVTTEYIFHLEDDWEFLKPGPIMAESLAILRAYPNVSTVTLTNHKGWVVRDPAYSCLINKPSHAGMDVAWDGITFNPGLRRLSDYKILGRSLQKILGHKGCPELEVSCAYRTLGYVMADLGTQYVLHIGCDRGVPR